MEAKQLAPGREGVVMLAVCVRERRRASTAQHCTVPTAKSSVGDCQR
jgi:hypothetical protein